MNERSSGSFPSANAYAWFYEGPVFRFSMEEYHDNRQVRDVRVARTFGMTINYPLEGQNEQNCCVGPRNARASEESRGRVRYHSIPRNNAPVEQ
eukprot:scaffold1141_cov333-Pavlova_lutheri.AAC.10